MLIAIWPLIILIIGLLIYFASPQAKLAEVGRLMFFVGLLWTVYRVAEKTFVLG